LLVLDGTTVHFRHELARAAVEQSMPPATRLALHRKLLDLLGARPAGTVPLAHLAHHARQAGDVFEVLRWAPSAAQEAAARGARREAAAHCETALAHAAQLPLAAQAQLLELLGDSRFELNELEQAAASYGQAAALLASAERPGDQARCLAKQAMPLVRMLRNEEADRVSGEALAIARRSGDLAATCHATAIESYLRMLNRDYRLAIEAGELATRLALELGDKALLASGYKTTGAALIFLDYAAGCALIERSLEAARELPDGGFAEADAHLMLGTASAELFEFATAERWIEEGIAFARSRDLDRQALYMEAWQAMCDMYAGRWDPAGDRAIAVLEHDRQPSTARVVALVTLGRLRTRRGDPGAGEVLDEALALALRSGTLQRLGPTCLARAEAAWLRGANDAVMTEVARVWDLAVGKGQPWIVGELAYWRMLAGGSAEPGAACAQPYAAELRGDWAGASQLWLARGCPYEAARAFARGPGEAQVQALKLLDPLNAQPLAARVRLGMRNAGLTAVPRGPAASTRANPAGLTRRELQVLQLLAGNLKNHEIAAQLSRSVRTVDHHLESLYAKLEVSNRAAAIARARELGLAGPK
jgi:DNA-binding CsgD family transcriptional regulator